MGPVCSPPPNREGAEYLQGSDDFGVAGFQLAGLAEGLFRILEVAGASVGEAEILE